MSGNLNGFRSSGGSPDMLPTHVPQPSPALAALLTFPALGSSSCDGTVGSGYAMCVAAGMNPAAMEWR